MSATQPIYPGISPAAAQANNAIADGIMYVAQAPIRVFSRIFGPLGNKTIFFVNDLLGKTSMPAVRAHPLLAAITGVAVVAATILLIQKALPQAGLLHARSLVDWAEGKVINSGAQMAGAVGLLAATATAVYFTATGILNGVLFGVA